MNSQKTKTGLILILVAVALEYGIYSTNKFENPSDVEKNEAETITIVVPQNIDGYKTAMIEYAQVGEGRDPVEVMPFEKKQIAISDITDIEKTSANLAAQAIDPDRSTVSYFKIENGTAYILLNIDLEGWAGVSVVTAQVHPVVEKTLLEFPEIDKVVFDFAPGDSPENK